MSPFSKKCLIFFEFISFLLIIITYILYIVQSFVNQNFTNQKTRSDLTEKYLYEYFSKEIYDNIKSYPINKIQNKTNVNLRELNIETKLNSYFDCQGIFNGLLNEGKCQDKIVNNLTCCKSECCKKNGKGETFCNNYDFNIRKISLNKNILIYNNDEIFDDPRRRYCQYMNLFSGNISRILNYNLQMEQYNYTYENILLNANNINNFAKIAKKEYEEKDFIDCGEIDSLENHLFVKGIKCPINYIAFDVDNNLLFFDSIIKTSLGIIVKNYLSELPPLIHEWNDIYKEGNITIKDINELLNKENSDYDYNNYYKKQDAYFYINQLPTLRNNYNNKVNPYQKFYWYTTNYIGFDSVEDLKDFKSIFNENDMNDNPLYKMTNSLIPSVGTSVICIILSLLYIIFLIKFVLDVKKNLFVKKCFFKLKDFIILITLIIYFIIYLVYAHGKYKKISINIDPNYKDILDLYNKRRKQKYFLAGIILHFFVSAYEIFFYIVTKEKGEKNKLYEINLRNIDATEININNITDTAEKIEKNVEIIQNSTVRLKESLKFSVGADEKIKVIKFEPC